MIDGLHLSNHKQKACHKKYNPDIVKKAIPGANLLCAEQVFSWQSRYAKIMNSMQGGQQGRHYRQLQGGHWYIIGICAASIVYY